MKVLVLGDGLLGGEIVKHSDWDCFSRKKNGFDIKDLSQIPKGYDVILNCIANTDTYSNDRDSHWDTNYAFVNRLIDYCNNNSIKLVQISTDYVYTGSESLASESSVPVHCENWYGYTKLLSDGIVQLRSNNYLLFRCTQIPNPFPYDEAWIDRIGNLDYVDVISNLIIGAIRKNLNGLYNLGTEVKTTFDLAKRTKPNVSMSFKPKHVPSNVSMDISKLNKDLNKPFFSIAIPTYGYEGKGSEFLNFNLDILAKQTFKNFEIVISDHSTDSTIKNVVDQWRDKLHIKYISCDKGRGVISPNINNAMRHCKGDWIKILFQDDFLYNEDSLQIQHDFIKSNQDMTWLMTKFYHSNNGFDFYNLYTPHWVDDIWTGNNRMGCPSGMTLKNKDLIFFDENLNLFMDVDFYKRMYDLHGNPYILNEITYVNRTWGARLTDTITQEERNKDYEICMKKYA